MNPFEREVKEIAKRFYITNPQIKPVKLLYSDNNNVIKCNCGKFKWKLYKKWGGIVRGKYRKIIKDNPVRYNFICECGNRLAIFEEEFKYGKITFGCSAGKCPFGKDKMDKNCLKCKYIYDK